MLNVHNCCSCNSENVRDKSSVETRKLPFNLKTFWKCLFQILERNRAFIAWLFVLPDPPELTSSEMKMSVEVSWISKTVFHSVKRQKSLKGKYVDSWHFLFCYIGFMLNWSDTTASKGAFLWLTRSKIYRCDSDGAAMVAVDTLKTLLTLMNL